MFKSLKASSWFHFLIPIFVLVTILLGLNHVSSYVSPSHDFFMKLPYVLFLCMIILAHKFKRSRMAMISLTLLVSYWFIQYQLYPSNLIDENRIEFSLVTLLIPLGVFLVYLFRDTDLLNKMFIAYVIAIAFTTYWVYLLLAHLTENPVTTFDSVIFHKVTNISEIPLILIGYITLSMAVSITLLFRFKRPIDNSVYVTLIFVFASLVFSNIPYITCILFSALGALLLIYLISASHKLAFNDPLTGIPARNAMESDLKNLGRKYTIAMLDIDHFKKVNDDYGHVIGDDVLKLIAKKLEKLTGQGKVYRYGGEEFAIIFKGQNKSDSKDYLEFLRAAIERYEMCTLSNTNHVSDKVDDRDNRSDTLKVTISIGFSDNRKLSDPGKVLEAADYALYEAKEKGRNRIISR